jgi:hypothetical protein
VELFVFVIDSPVYSPPGSQDSPLYSPPRSQDSLEYSPLGSQPKLLSKTVAGAKYSRESRLSYWIHNGAVTLCCIRHKSFYLSTILMLVTNRPGSRDSPVYSPQGSRDSSTYSPLGSQDFPVYSLPRSRDPPVFRDNPSKN